MTRFIFCLLLAFCQSSLADDFKTINGKEYKNATVSRIEPDGIVIKFSGGIVKLPFAELPKDVQQKFNYQPQKAAEYTQAQIAAVQESNQQVQSSLEQRRAANIALREAAAEQQAKQSTIQALVDQLASLQQQEENILAEIGRIQNAQEMARRRWYNNGTFAPPNSTEANLPLLRGRLDNVRDETERVRRELIIAQRQP